MHKQPNNNNNDDDDNKISCTAWDDDVVGVLMI